MLNIYYTLDGSDPVAYYPSDDTPTQPTGIQLNSGFDYRGTRYEEPIRITEDTVLRAVSVREAVQSNLVEERYAIDIKAPEISGLYTEVVCDTGANDLITDRDGIYKYYRDGTSELVLSKSRTGNLRWHDGWMYFTFNYSLCRYQEGADSLEYVVEGYEDDSVNRFAIWEDNIYYCASGPSRSLISGGIFRCTLTGENITQISENNEVKHKLNESASGCDLTDSRALLELEPGRNVRVLAMIEDKIIYKSYIPNGRWEDIDVQQWIYDFSSEST